MKENRKILAIVSNLAVYRSLEAVLQKAGMGLHRAPSGAGGLILLGNRRYDLLLVEAPLPDVEMEDMLASLHSLDSLCGSCPVVLLAPQKEVKSLRRQFRGSVAGTLSKTAGERELQKVLSRVLGVSSRAGARLLVQVTLDSPAGAAARLFQTQNLSQSGMLVRASEIPPVGARLKLSFTLPSDSRPIVCDGEVVRHADPVKEGLRGFALQFLGLREDERERIQGCVEVDLSASEAPKLAATG